MKYFLLTLAFVAFCFNMSFAQHSCGMSDSPTSSQQFQGLKFFDENDVCDPIILKCNFIIMRRDDGTGAFPLNHSAWSYWINSINEELANIKDPHNCSSGYPLDSKIRVDVEIHTIDNTAAWDWYAEAIDDGWPASQDPDRYICPDVSVWEELDDEMDNFESNNLGDINFFFVENGEHIEFLEDHIANGTVPSQPYVDIYSAAPGNDGAASGCSHRPPGSYNTAIPDNSYIINNTYGDYLARNYFHEIYFPDYADETSQTVWNWELWGKDLLFLHEMGHNIIDEGHPSGCGQLMTSNWGVRTNHITKSQLEDIHMHLARTDLHQAVDCSSITDNTCSIKAIDDVTIDEPISVYGDLIIESGKTLTVTSSMQLSEFSEIIVEPNAKLIVDGGTLTNGCGDTWIGVKVYGGNSDFDVQFTNQATIENTSHAAVSMFAPVPWPDIRQYGNGILHADNTTFNNTSRIVEFMSWFPLPNSSFVVDCIQNGGKWSITNWNCLDILIKDNTFNNITSNCIVVETGSMLIEDNTFFSGENDILYNNVSAGRRSRIWLNLFSGANTGYRANGTTLAQNHLYQNVFQNGNIGVINDGHNNFDINLNDFFSSFGTISRSNGAGIGDIHNNQFIGNSFGILTLNKNSFNNMYENCFTTISSDMYISGNISPVIQSNGNAANNCFTHMGNNLSNIKDITGNPDPFVYLEPEDGVIDCKDAILSHTSVTREQAGSSVNLECGAGFEIGSDYWNECRPPMVLGEALNSYNWLQQQIITIENDTSLTEKQKDRFILYYSRCLERTKAILFEVYLEEENFTEARNLYQSDTLDYAKVFVFSSYIFENDTTSARSYINQLITESEQLKDFKTIQNINLDRLHYGPYYTPKSDELDTIKNIGLKSHPFASYGRALYYSLTGEILSSELPDLAESRIINSSNNMQSNPNANTRVYPNPFADNLNIEIDRFKSCTIKIVNMFGKVVYLNDNIVTGPNVISTYNWGNGIYIVNISINNKQFVQEKVLLIR